MNYDTKPRCAILYAMENECDAMRLSLGIS
jgi:hypothetical protein